MEQASTSILPSLAHRIEAAHQRASQSARAALAAALECGQLLAEAKTSVAHGAWLPWLSANTSLGVRQAQKYMRLAEAHAAGALNTSPRTHLT